MDTEAAGWVVAVDGRDGFITWLRGEFAAANAIIDLLLAHLRAAAGDPAAEYEPIAASVHRRRHHWAPSYTSSTTSPSPTSPSRSTTPPPGARGRLLPRGATATTPINAPPQSEPPDPREMEVWF